MLFRIIVGVSVSIPTPVEATTFAAVDHLFLRVSPMVTSELPGTTCSLIHPGLLSHSSLYQEQGSQVEMASIIACLPPPVLINGRNFVAKTTYKCGLCSISERRGHLSVAVKAMGESSEPASSLSIVKSVQNVWDKSEDRLALIGLGFAAIVAVWASANLISAIDKLPVLPSLFELIGILFSSWFIYRYLLFKPDREELVQNINKSISDILGQ
ncbi:hypothetical protein Ancab_012206 [Ancistrocladus abbreviatus]